MRPRTTKLLAAVAVVEVSSLTLGGWFLHDKVDWPPTLPWTTDRGDVGPDRAAWAAYTPTAARGVTRPRPELGPGTPADVRGARMSRDGETLQVAVTVQRCQAVTGVSSRESPLRVRIVVETASPPRECRGRTYWWVPVPLDSPVDDRLLVGWSALKEETRPILLVRCDDPAAPHYRLCGNA